MNVQSSDPTRRKNRKRIGPLAAFFLLAAVTLSGSASAAPMDACPTNLTAAADSDGIHLRWDAAPNATGYLVERAQDGGDLTRVDELDRNATGYTDFPVRPEVTYTYRVTALPADAEAADCPTVAATAIPFLDGLIPMAIATAGGLGAFALLRRR